MSNVQAALGVAQLERLDEFVTRKRAAGRRYTEVLKEVTGLQIPLVSTDYAENIYWVYGIVLNEEIPFGAEEAMKRLAAQGIGTRPFFWPMHEQPIFSRMGLFHGVQCPVAARLARRGFYIPSGLALSDQDISSVIIALQVIAVGN